MSSERNIKILRLVLIVFILFYIPWVFTFATGILVYFPYHEKENSRYIRVTGGLAKYLGADWVSSKEIPKVCKMAVVVAEDNEFFNHHGIHVPSILASIKDNFKQGKIISGGSTISQQLVKNAFLSRSKNYFRKSREIVGALLLDLFFSKDTQLTWYLNVVEFGPNLYGIKAASKIYFQKNANTLTKRDCAVLATFLTRPVFYGGSYQKGQQPLGFQRRFHRIYLGLSE
jgi:monofunctional glycosyltransferase